MVGANSVWLGIRCPKYPSYSVTTTTTTTFLHLEKTLTIIVPGCVGKLCKN